MNYGRLVRIILDRSNPDFDYSNLQVDHIDHNKLNDSPDNLRWLTITENLKNRVFNSKPNAGKIILLTLEDGTKQIYLHKFKDQYPIPYQLIHSLASMKYGTNYSKKYKISAEYVDTSILGTLNLLIQ